MNVHQLGIRHRRREKLALNGFRLILAVVFSTLGCVFFFVPRVVEDLARAGYGPGVRFLLGASHLAGGIALLLPHLAEKVAIALGLFVAGVTVYLLAGGEDTVTVEPALMAFFLLLVGAWLRLRHRADVKAWRELLARYADQQNPRGTGKA
jgi:uncharacterized membrane protein YphA (DoxX/SURF4 family)